MGKSQEAIGPDFYLTEKRSDILLEISKKHNLPAHTTRVLVEQLTESMQNVLDIGAGAPSSTKVFLGWCIAGTPKNFQEKTITPLKDKAQTPGYESYEALAQSLETLRNFSQKNKDFLHETYGREIEMIGGDSLADKQDKFTSFVGTITTLHIKEVINEIEKEYLKDQSLAGRGI